MNKEELCKKIQEIYPDIGQCGINLDVTYDEEKKAWAVNLERKGKRLSHYLDEEDIKACMEGRKTVRCPWHPGWRTQKRCGRDAFNKAI